MVRKSSREKSDRRNTYTGYAELPADNQIAGERWKQHRNSRILGIEKAGNLSKDFLLSDTAGRLAYSYFYYILVTVKFSFPIYETRYFLIAIEEQTARISSL